MIKPQIIEMTQREYEPDQQYVAAMWGAMEKAFGAITVNPKLDPDAVELFCEWLIQLVEDDAEKEKIYRFRDSENTKLLGELAKRKSIDVKDLSPADKDQCWKKSNVHAIGKVVKWFGRYYSATEHRTKVGFGTLSGDGIIYWDPEHPPEEK